MSGLVVLTVVYHGLLYTFARGVPMFAKKPLNFESSTSYRIFLTSLYVLEGCKDVFRHQGKDSAIIHFSYHCSFSRSFDVAELSISSCPCESGHNY